MILVFDTYYFKNKANTVCLEFNTWTASEEVNSYYEILNGIDDYVPGEFYKRELPCILSLLNKIDLTKCEAIIVDGFVVLDDQEKLGLGGYLYDKLQKKIPIIGVAKNNFHNLKLHKKAILRGDSQKPLYVTSKGIDLDIAADKIKNMHGEYRIPTLLKKVDSLGRDNQH
ncbi:Endonuclease V [Tenacibaculum sp. MAR_2009_124]|uniref:endonuclease V n=1 Tax=Tenacibaculum sp. MAR_2009_124 TaxID=1250059 RepID=UPI00089C4A08|nr:endonuclease V [Tenacibaculum sp. MAR_2009_124]SEC88383.1 Endonuclease V [Tenacibaculum sp. MAR_2009_124]